VSCVSYTILYIGIFHINTTYQQIIYYERSANLIYRHLDDLVKRDSAQWISIMVEDTIAWQTI